MSHYDVIIAGGGFGGLVCAKTLAQAGIRTLLLERKKAPGIGMHTTGIIVGECAEEFSLPEHLTRRISRVRLYAPNMKCAELATDSYFFLATDTPAVMRHLSDEALRAGAEILYDTAYEKGEIAGSGVVVNGQHHARFLIGADGPRSKVADDFALGQNTAFLLGAEAEYTGLPLADDGAFYCFLDQKLARGYLGWVIPSVGVSQVGIAQRLPRKPEIDAFVGKMKGVFDFSAASVVARRGGLIPVGGLVHPFATDRVFLLGDSAGIVSPLTAGGIHTAMHYGKRLAEHLAATLHGHTSNQSAAEMLQRCYPRFHFKQGLRKSFEHLAPDWLLNQLIGNRLFTIAANHIFFKKKKLR